MKKKENFSKFGKKMGEYKYYYLGEQHGKNKINKSESHLA